jgi:Mg-chelatase subunit ChlD
MRDMVPLPRIQDTSATVILADVSGSMRGAKIQRLRSELGKLWPEITARLMSFADRLNWIENPSHLPEPSGGTDLAGALDLAATVWPAEVIVISDGMPADEDAALRAAERIPGTISVLFVGSDDDQRGLVFLRRLAAVGGGQFAHRDLGKTIGIAGEIRSMLALPPPISLGGHP